MLLLLLYVLPAAASTCTFTAVRSIVSLDLVVHEPVEAFEGGTRQAFEAGIHQVLNQGLTSPIEKTRILITGLKPIMWDTMNLPSNYDTSVGSSSKVTTEITVEGGDEEAALISNQLHALNEGSFGTALNMTVQTTSIFLLLICRVAARASMQECHDCRFCFDCGTHEALCKVG